MFRDWLVNVLNYLGFGADEEESDSSDSRFLQPGQPESDDERGPIDERMTYFVQLLVDLPVILTVLRVVMHFLA